MYILAPNYLQYWSVMLDFAGCNPRLGDIKYNQMLPRLF